MTNENKLPQTLEQRIAEKVGQNLVDLIPEDQWQQLVNTEIQKCKEEILPNMVRQEFEKAVKEIIVAEVSKYTYAHEFRQNTGEYVSKELEQFIGDSAGVIVSGMLSPTMAMIITDLRNRMQY